MSDPILRLIEDELASGTAATLSEGIRAIYCVKGSVNVADGDADSSALAATETVGLEPNDAWFGIAGCILQAGTPGAQLWRWELVSNPADDGRIDESGIRSDLKASHSLELDPGGAYLMRCDRVDFPLGGIAYTHTHPGPGIRCLLLGEIRIQVEGRETTYRPGRPWFERGPDPVLALASETDATSFVRGMILPRSLQGRSSIQYVDPADANKPKLQQYTRFIDEFIELKGFATGA